MMATNPRLGGRGCRKADLFVFAAGATLSIIGTLFLGDVNPLWGMESLTGVARGEVRLLRVYVRFTPSFGRANWTRRRSQIDPKLSFRRV